MEAVLRDAEGSGDNATDVSVDVSNATVATAGSSGQLVTVWLSVTARRNVLLLLPPPPPPPLSPPPSVGQGRRLQSSTSLFDQLQTLITAADFSATHRIECS